MENKTPEESMQPENQDVDVQHQIQVDAEIHAANIIENEENENEKDNNNEITITEDFYQSESQDNPELSPDSLPREQLNELDENMDFIRSNSSIGSAYTIQNESLSSEEMENEDYLNVEIETNQINNQNSRNLRRSSVSTMHLPTEVAGSNRSIYTSIVLMPEQGVKWNQLAERDSISKFCVIPVLEQQLGPKVHSLEDSELSNTQTAESAESSLESNNPLRTLLARRAISMHSELSPVAEMPFGSAVDINESIRDIRIAKTYGQVLPDKKNLRRNFLLECLSFFFVYIGFVPIRGLQTSLNHRHSLGSISLSTLFGSSIIGSLICPILVQRYGAKRTVAASFIAFLLYAIGNVYASFYTLIPASVIQGFGFSILLGAQGAYQTNLAATYSTVTQTKIEKVLPFFGGIYFTFLQSANIIGNGLSSTILKALGPIIDPNFYDQIEVENDTNTDVNRTESQSCGADFCNVFTDSIAFHVSPKALYTLFGTLICLIIVGMIICTFFVDRLDCIFKKKKKSLWSHLKTVFSYHKDYKTWLLLFLAVYAAFGPAFVYGNVLKAFVTCPLGVDMIGYATVFYASASALTALSSGHVSKLVGPRALQYVGFLGSVCMYTTMLLWRPDPDQPYLIFCLFSCLGATHSIYQTRYYSLVGILYAGRTETAFSFFLTYQSIVGVLVFGLSPILCMTLKLYLAAGLMAATCVAYSTLIYCLKKEEAELKETEI